VRYRLRTLLILLAVLPSLLAVGWWKYSEWKAEQERLRVLNEWTLEVQPGLVAVPPPPSLPVTAPPVRAPNEPQKVTERCLIRTLLAGLFCARLEWACDA
jgi:hypothetical protein